MDGTKLVIVSLCFVLASNTVGVAARRSHFLNFKYASELFKKHYKSITPPTTTSTTTTSTTTSTTQTTTLFTNPPLSYTITIDCTRYCSRNYRTKTYSVQNCKNYGFEQRFCKTCRVNRKCKSNGETFS